MISKLRHRLTLNQATEATDSGGRLTKTTATVATVWGSIEPISGQERLLAQQVQSSTSHRIRIRKPVQNSGGTDVTPTSGMWFTSGSRRFDIIAPPRDEAERGYFWICDCREKE